MLGPGGTKGGTEGSGGTTGSRAAPPRPIGIKGAGMPRREAGKQAGSVDLPDEGGFPSGVLPHEEHHGLVVEVGILQRR